MRKKERKLCLLTHDSYWHKFQWPLPTIRTKKVTIFWGKQCELIYNFPVCWSSNSQFETIRIKKKVLFVIIKNDKYVGTNLTKVVEDFMEKITNIIESNVLGLSREIEIIGYR